MAKQRAKRRPDAPSREEYVKAFGEAIRLISDTKNAIWRALKMPEAGFDRHFQAHADASDHLYNDLRTAELVLEMVEMVAESNTPWDVLAEAQGMTPEEYSADLHERCAAYRQPVENGHNQNRAAAAV